MIEYVAGFLFSEDLTHVMLIKKEKPDWQKGLYNAVGGKIEKNETALQAINREVLEETGVTGIDWKLSTILSSEEKEEYYIPFVDIRGRTAVAERPVWRVRFFEGFSDNIYNCESKTDEQVDLFLTDDLPFNKINNIDLLIQIALNDCFIKPVKVINKANLNFKRPNQ